MSKEKDVTGKISKAVLLAGGLGSRLSEETDLRPKPLVEIGGRPILWHIMKIYHHFGIDEFVVCLGYKGYLIKEYFSNYFLHMSDVTIDFGENKTVIHNRRAENWKVTLIDTGAETMTGGRLKRVEPYLNGEHFCMTYGDGLGDVDIRALLYHHQTSGCDATVTVVRPPGRFGAVNLDGTSVAGFREKPAGDDGWINGGFFVLSPRVFQYIDGDATVWEQTPMDRLVGAGELTAFRHDGFWHPMDTLRDKRHLEDLWAAEKAPWKVWDREGRA